MWRSLSWFLGCFACLLVSPSVCSDDIQSSMSNNPAGQQAFAALRFFAVTKTMSTTTTVVQLYTSYSRQTCLFVPLGTPHCSAPTTPAPPTTTTPQPTTTTAGTTTTSSTTTTTTAAPTTAGPATTANPATTPALPFKIVEGEFSPSISTSITVNKISPPKVQFNLPSLAGQGAGLGNFFKPGGGVKVTANMTADLGTGSQRKRRSPIMNAKIQPSAVAGVEMTASPEMSLREAIQQDVAVEASRTEEYHEYEITGMMPHHFSNRALPFFGESVFTIVRVDPVTVTVKKTVTSQYPILSPADRVTMIYVGCVPADAPNLPHCA